MSPADAMNSRREASAVESPRAEVPAEENVLEVPEDLGGRRADAVIAATCGVSRARAAEWIDRQLVRWAVDRTQGRAAGVPVKKSDRIPAGPVLALDARRETDPHEVIPEVVQDLTVLYQDDDLIVVNKPVGVAAHGSPGWTGPTVLSGLLGAGVPITTSGAQERRGIVHRLDVGTSGAMVVAKTERAYTGLKESFKSRRTQKTYHALVQGLPDPTEGTIDAPIGRHPGYEWRFAVVEGGREAVTRYRLSEAYGRASLMEVALETGRTHQIRVHFSALGHPCAGDLTYGADPRLAAELGLTRQWLHAAELGFTHPGTGQWVSFTAEYPADLVEALHLLGEH